MKSFSTFLLVIVVFLFAATPVLGQLLLQETFKDTTSNIATYSNWTELTAGTIGSTVAPPYIVVKPNSALTYTGYIESGNGNSAYLTGGGQDAQVVVRDVSSGVVYLAFMIKVDSATVAGDYIWIVRNTSNHNRWRMWLKRDTTGGSTNAFNFGIGMGGSLKQYTAAKYTFGTTYLVIAKYDFNTSASTNDAKLNLWVNPPIGSATEDPNPVIKDYTESATADFPVINRLALVMNAVATAPTFWIGGIRMGAKWIEVLPPPPLYYNGTGAINDPNSWGKNSNGSGAHPSDFASDNQLYLVGNTTTVNLTTQWIVSGVGAKVIIGSGVNLTVATGGILAATVDVNSGGTLTLTQSSFWPAFGDVGGIVSFNNASGFSLDADYTFPTGSGFYDLKAGDLNLSGKTLTVRGKLRLNGNKVFGTGTFKLDSAGALYISSPNGIMASGTTGDIQSSTRQFSRYAGYAYIGAANQVTGDAIPDSVANLTIQMANRGLTTTLSKFVASNGNLNLTLGKFKLGNFNLWFSNPAGQSDSSYVITDGTGSLIRPVSSTSKKTMPVGSATEYRVAAVTFPKTPVATNISFRYVSGDAGSVGLPTGATNYYKGGYWVIASDGVPGGQFRLDLYAIGVGFDTTAMRVLSRPNSTTAWTYAGLAAGYSGGSVADSTISNFGQFAIGLGPKTTAVEATTTIPKTFNLLNNYPNPFNPTTTIGYELPTETRVTLSVFNLIGQQVARLVDEIKPAGRHLAIFDASALSSGIYFYQFNAASFHQTRKMILIK